MRKIWETKLSHFKRIYFFNRMIYGHLNNVIKCFDSKNLLYFYIIVLKYKSIIKYLCNLLYEHLNSFLNMIFHYL